MLLVVGYLEKELGDYRCAAKNRNLKINYKKINFN